MKQASIQQFMAVTGSGHRQAEQFLEMSGGDVNTAIMLFFDSGVAASPDPVPAPAPRAPAADAKPHHKQSAAASEKGSSSRSGHANPAAHQKPAAATHAHPTQPPVSTDKHKPAKPSVPAPPPPPSKPTVSTSGAKQGTKFNTMADILNDKSDSDRTENEYFAGSGQKIRAPPPHTIKDVNKQEAEQESGCKIVIEFYSDGLLINGHEPFYPFNSKETEAMLDEMKTKQTLPKAILTALPESERPKPGQQIYTEIKNHPEAYSSLKQTTESSKKVYTFDSNEKPRSLGDCKKAVKHPQHVSAPASTPSTTITEPSLALIPGKPVAPVRVRADKVYTLQTNPERHTIKDLIDCLRKAGVNLPTPSECLVKVTSTSTTLSDISMTIAGAKLERQQIIIVAK
ncbi:Hypothetical protein GLP15_2680 [Giardia lamblia P15]|uniref:UBA-like domain-containing protein n=1 Tax=Giardia intestinalis (strain P15) TaxID=658858 RepID=E1F490_GIAIA|nr:Hypothetical protein GLP15_2680 [Giardia lamblia P15]